MRMKKGGGRRKNEKERKRREKERGRRHTPILVLGLYRMLSMFEELKRTGHSFRGVRFSQCVGQIFQSILILIFSLDNTPLGPYTLKMV